MKEIDKWSFVLQIWWYIYFIIKRNAENKILLLNGTCVASCESTPGYVLNEKAKYCSKIIPGETITQKICEMGFYYNVELRGCYKCDPKCKTCIAFASDCDSCAENRNYDSNCSICQYGLFENAAGECIACERQCSTCSKNSSECLECNGYNRK